MARRHTRFAGDRNSISRRRPAGGSAELDRRQKTIVCPTTCWREVSITGSQN